MHKNADAATALRVMVLLRGVATRGTTILCSLHQPRPQVLNLLDKVMLLSKGQVAYFGAPADASRYFFSVGRPFPEDQTHPADAMLTLTCRQDGGDLPALFRRSSMAAAAHSAALAAISAAAAATVVPVRDKTVENNATGSPPTGPGGGGGSDGGGNGNSMRDENDVETELIEVGDQWEDTAIRATRRGRSGCQGRVALGSGGAGGAGREINSTAEGSVFQRKMRGDGERRSTASFWVQVEVLSRRLLLRAIRHPLLLVLHFGGSVAMSLCLGSVFGGRLEFNLAGAQDR